jgi:two-component system KDP operon response regulator KdpE
LLARIRTALRASANEHTDPVLNFNGLEIDLSLRTVKKNKELLKLTSTEYSLLTLFIKNEGRVLTHHFLLKEIWGPSFINESQYLRVYIAQLRKKIETNPNRPEYLITEPGVGYRFSAKE